MIGLFALREPCESLAEAVQAGACLPTAKPTVWVMPVTAKNTPLEVVEVAHKAIAYSSAHCPQCRSDRWHDGCYYGDADHGCHVAAACQPIICPEFILDGVKDSSRPVCICIRT